MAKTKWQEILDESRNLIDDWEDQILNDPKLKNLPDDKKLKIVEILFLNFQKEVTDFIEQKNVI